MNRKPYEWQHLHPLDQRNPSKGNHSVSIETETFATRSLIFNYISLNWYWIVRRLCSVIAEEYETRQHYSSHECRLTRLTVVQKQPYQKVRRKITVPCLTEVIPFFITYLCAGTFRLEHGLEEKDSQCFSDQVNLFTGNVTNDIINKCSVLRNPSKSFKSIKLTVKKPQEIVAVARDLCRYRTSNRDVYAFAFQSVICGY